LLKLIAVNDVFKVYWLPPDSGDKIPLSITVLLSFSVLLFVVSDSIPPSSENTPVLSKNTIRIQHTVFSGNAKSFGVGGMNWSKATTGWWVGSHAKLKKKKMMKTGHLYSAFS